MVLQCLHYNNTESNCAGAYLECAKQVDCSEGGHCFVVWQVDGNINKPLNAGCNPPYPSSPDECSNECIGQTKGSKYYCCCKGNLCNTNFTQPVQKREDIGKPKEIDFATPASNNVLWSVIPIVLLLTLVGASIYWFRKGVNKNHKNSISNSRNNSNENNQNRRNKGVSGNLNDMELDELRNNHDVSTLIPFRNNFGVDHIYGNNNHPNLDNNDHNQQLTLTNHLHHHDNNNKQQEYIRIDLNSIKLLEIIGSGRFGTVHRASMDDPNNSEIAVKIISSIEHDSWLNEQQIYHSPRIRHQNILKFLYSDEHLETGNYWLVVEYASKGSLYSFLKDNVVKWKEFLHVALGIVRGLSHLHDADIAHRDFKSKNVLLKHDLTPCITDFGVAAILDTNPGSQLDHRKKYLQVGTPRYMAPEVLECSVTFTKTSFTKIDVYALSLVLWELISRCWLISDNEPPPYRLPFEDFAGPNPDINEMRQIVVVDKLRPILRDEWRVYPASEFCRAIEDGWEYDHDARISASCFVERVESLSQSI